MKTIIIVEDEFGSRVGLKKLIEKLSTEVRVIGEAENGYEGLKMIVDMVPDIVITDVRMPKMNGLEMISELKKIGIESTFVILSGYSEFEYARQGMKLGVLEYLLKPVTVADVTELLKKIVGEDKDNEVIENYEHSDVVTNMRKYIDANYSMKIGLNTFSDMYKLTPEYLSNLFAKETGETFSNYLKKIRIEKAKDLILTTDMKVYKIAYMVGYPDQKYFSKVFKEYTGVSAKQFALERQISNSNC